MTAGVILIPIIPLAGWLLLAAVGNRLGERGVRAFASIACVAMLGLVCGLFAAIRTTQEAEETPGSGVQGAGITVTLVERWLSVGAGDYSAAGRTGVSSAFALRFDVLAGVMLAAIALAAMAAACRGTDGGPDAQRRFARGLLLCLAAAAGTILAADFLQFFVLWSLLSLAGWRLFDVEAERSTDNAAGRSLLLSQRLADVALAVGLFSMWSWRGAFDMAGALEAGAGGAPDWLMALDDRHPGSAMLLAACLLAGAVGRCAQFPIFGWLNDAGKSRAAANAAIVGVAMPVGVYLLVRTSPLFAAAPDARLLAMALGGMTIALAGVIACAQTNLKPAISFAAAAQFGFAFVGFGIGTGTAVAAAVLLAATHAVACAVMLSFGEDVAAAGGGELSPASGAPAGGDTGAPAPSGGARDDDGGEPAGRIAVIRWRIPTAARWSFAAAAVLAASGLWGEHAILGELWNEIAGPHSGGETGPADGSTESAVGPFTVPLLAIGTAGLFLIAVALSRAFVRAFGLQRGRLRIVTGEAEPRAVTSWVRGAMVLATAAAPLSGAWALVWPGAHPFGGGTGLPVALAGIVCGWWWVRAGESSFGRMFSTVARLGRRRFYLEDVFFLGVVVPVRAVAQIGRFVDWFVVDGLLVGLPVRLAMLAARTTVPLRAAGARFYLLSMALAAAVLLWVLLWRS